MAVEIERKFLLKGDGWRSRGTGTLYRQGYLSRTVTGVVRVRIAGDRGFLTIKGRNDGIQRLEFEYEIPLTDATALLENLCDRPLIEKIRYRVKQSDLVWEIDEFLGENQGLIVAEVELNAVDQSVDLPDWIDKEVTDSRYFNANLVKYPYCQWTQAEKLGIT